MDMSFFFIRMVLLYSVNIVIQQLLGISITLALQNIFLETYPLHLNYPNQVVTPFPSWDA